MNTEIVPNTLTVPILTGLRHVAARYDGFILDLWGVVHDGVAVFPGVIDALARLRAAGKRLVFLSNAPRRAAAVEAQLAGFGIGCDLHDGVLSSGEITWRHLDARPDDWYRALGRACLRIGPGRDLGILEGLDLEPVGAVGEAEFILVTGPSGDREGRATAYDDMLEAALSRHLPMICANPDREVIRGGHRQICAGAIAERYERMGGEVRWHGKPDAAIYDDCFVMLGIRERDRILAIGDSFTTDIRGANAAGLGALLVARGIHGDTLFGEDGRLDGARIARGAAEAGVAVIGAMGDFVW